MTTIEELEARLNDVWDADEAAHPAWNLARDAIAALKEARAAALEEAARVCEQQYGDPNWHPFYIQGAKSCATSIRALTKSPTSEGG